MSRITKKPGYGPHRGSTNPRMRISSVSPVTNLDFDMWGDSNIAPVPLYFYDTSTGKFKLFGNKLYKIKTANQTVTSSTALVDDTHIVFNLQKESVYLIEFHAAAYSNSATPDIKFAWSVTGGASGTTARVCMGLAVGVTDHTSGTMRCSRHTLATEVPYGVVSGSTSCEIFEKFIVTTTTAGTLTLQWAQYVSDATAVGLSTSTFATAEKLS